MINPQEQATQSVKLRYSNCSEYRSKLVFEEKEIPFPTSFIVLPYELKRDSSKKLVVKEENSVDVAAEIGSCLLKINKATAKLSFWLQLKRDLSKHEVDFKDQVKDWLLRARMEGAEAIAREIVEKYPFEAEYYEVCKAMLEPDSLSNTSAYLVNPRRTAYDDIRRATRSLLKFYERKPILYFYLVDELRGKPIASREGEPGFSYPLRIEPTKELLNKLFFPLMNLSAMSVMTLDGLNGLESLLGIPSTAEISSSRWAEDAIGMVHKIDQKHSVTAFATLQRKLRAKFQLGGGDRYHDTDDFDVHWEGRSADQCKSEEMKMLAKFYMKHDSARDFCGLNRIFDGKKYAVWSVESSKTRQKSQPVIAHSPDNTHSVEVDASLPRKGMKNKAMKRTRKMEKAMHRAFSSSKRTIMSASTASTKRSSSSEESMIGLTLTISNDSSEGGSV